MWEGYLVCRASRKRENRQTRRRLNPSATSPQAVDVPSRGGGLVALATRRSFPFARNCFRRWSISLRSPSASRKSQNDQPFVCGYFRPRAIPITLARAIPPAVEGEV